HWDLAVEERGCEHEGEGEEELRHHRPHTEAREPGFQVFGLGAFDARGNPWRGPGPIHQPPTDTNSDQ
ncbi:MAG: hypothetical protein K9M97_11550, partial [Akkermansiaceae bacterium]|nr:hypothetical protein [Akkermansiaceae bacterium]